LGALPGMILCTSFETDGTGLTVSAFKQLPKNKKVLSTVAYRQSALEEKIKGSLRPLAEDKVDWVYAMS
jgi:hypothetical protein